MQHMKLLVIWFFWYTSYIPYKSARIPFILFLFLFYFEILLIKHLDKPIKYTYREENVLYHNIIYVTLC